MIDECFRLRQIPVLNVPSSSQGSSCEWRCFVRHHRHQRALACHTAGVIRWLPYTPRATSCPGDRLSEGRKEPILLHGISFFSPQLLSPFLPRTQHPTLGRATSTQNSTAMRRVCVCVRAWVGEERRRNRGEKIATGTHIKSGSGISAQDKKVRDVPGGKLKTTAQVSNKSKTGKKREMVAIRKEMSEGKEAFIRGEALDSLAREALLCLIAGRFLSRLYFDARPILRCSCPPPGRLATRPDCVRLACLCPCACVCVCVPRSFLA